MLEKWLADLGVFVRPNFLQPELCRNLCSELSSAPARPAIINRGLKYRGVDENLRRTKVAEASSASQALLTASLITELPSLSDYFERPLVINEEPKCLRYEAGDFFRPHQDNPPNQPGPSVTRSRRVSVIIFLNQREAEETEMAAGYEGGELVLYGLLRQPGYQTKGIPLRGFAGWLVAFRSDVCHEVRPVKRGERYSVVSWLTDAPTEVRD